MAIHITKAQNGVSSPFHVKVITKDQPTQSLRLPGLLEVGSRSSTLGGSEVLAANGSQHTCRIYDSTNTTGHSMHDPGAAHSGGSCQASFSYDDGETWIVVQSWEGNCLRVRKGQEGQLTNSYDLDQTYSFDLPDSLPGSNSVIFAW